MEKIVVAVDGQHINMPLLDFACYLGRLTNSKITGVFLENLVADQKPVLKPLHGVPSVEWETDQDSPQYIEKTKAIEKNIAFFKTACLNRSVDCKIHRDRGVPAHEIIEESRYSDLIVVDAATSFNTNFEGAPTEFVKDVLKDAECPVIIAPESFDDISEIIFAYDGSKSSVFAIKQFSYLFPQFSSKKTIVVQVNEKGIWTDKDKYNLKEWLQNRYSSIEFEALKGNSNDGLFDYFFKRKNIVIVMGAYGRSLLSNFFKHSHADRLIKIITQPIFISHY